MSAFRPNLADYGFVWRDVLGLDELALVPDFAHASPDVVDAVLDQAARFCVNEIAPLDRAADEVGARFSAGEVSAPPGFADAYRRFVADGWPGLHGPEAAGGQALPASVNYCLYEMLSACSMAFVHYTALTHGAALLIAHHADAALKALYLPPLVTGRWSGTMCLTEAQAGSDLGLIRTAARAAGDGTYRLTGTKIFITAGEHDLAENIVHLVLARLPGSPEGAKGISLFLVPKLIPGSKGDLDSRNAVACGSIEHKMGIRGAATCVMHFDEAIGWLIGAPNGGLAAMFTMMNAERLLLSAQGQGIADAAYQNGVAYARDRRQGRAPGSRSPRQAADPIIDHPDIRRMLLTMRVHAEGGRMLGLWVVSALDRATADPDPERRAEAAIFVALMTPVVKVMLSDMGLEAAQLGVQVMGGHGYIRDGGMEQRVRDIRILQLYEGTNGIQALDLVQRKLPLENGGAIERLIAPAETAIAAASDAFAAWAAALAETLAAMRTATVRLAGPSSSPTESAAGASDYLQLVGSVALGALWLRAAVAARTRDDAFGHGKLACAQFFFERVLPRAQVNARAIDAGGAGLMALAADSF